MIFGLTLVQWFYLLIGCLFAGSAAYSGFIWVYLRGLRGLAMTMMFAGIAINAFAALWIGFDSRVHIDVVVGVQRTTILLSALSAVIVADRYAADANHHRALTTKLYIWFQRAAQENNHEA